MEVSQTKRTKPTFTLTNWLSLTVKRYTSGWEDGRWVTVAPSSFTVNANVQPMKYTDLMLLPESERTREWIKVYVELNESNHFSIRTAREGSDGWEADRFVWHGDEYRIMKIHHFEMGVLDHIKALAVREPISAKGSIPPATPPDDIPEDPSPPDVPPEDGGEKDD